MFHNKFRADYDRSIQKKLINNMCITLYKLDLCFRLHIPQLVFILYLTVMYKLPHINMTCTLVGCSGV